jgi:hypothetical protein
VSAWDENLLPFLFYLKLVDFVQKMAVNGFELKLVKLQ